MEEMIHFENLEAHDYVSNTEISSVGYKIYNSHNIETADSLILFCKLNPTFASKLDKDQQLDVLNRLMLSLSNMSPSKLISPSDCFDNLKSNRANDYF